MKWNRGRKARTKGGKDRRRWMWREAKKASGEEKEGTDGHMNEHMAHGKGKVKENIRNKKVK